MRNVRELGFSEDDPRADLNGSDAARKILILARECGIPLELADVRVESFVSRASARAKSVEAFLAQLKKEDALFEKKKRAAEKAASVSATSRPWRREAPPWRFAQSPRRTLFMTSREATTSSPLRPHDTKTRPWWSRPRRRRGSDGRGCVCRYITHGSRASYRECTMIFERALGGAFCP